MTEEELIKMAGYDWYHLEDVEDRTLITKKVVDNLRISNRQFYHRVLKGINPECISKEKALQLLQYDKEVYGLLTKELQEDKDILELTTCYPDELPKSLFNNLEGVKYVLNRYNIPGKSWCTFNIEYKYFIMKPDINVQYYYLYPHGGNSRGNYPPMLNVKGLTNEDPCIESKRIAEITSHYWTCFDFEFVQHID